VPSRDPLDLLGAAEIAGLLGVSRQRVTQLTHTDGFPAPVLRLRMGSLWHAQDVRDWAASHRPARGE
jgi:predicted DNA-binding transcriptional regulator AlpA